MKWTITKKNILGQHSLWIADTNMTENEWNTIKLKLQSETGTEYGQYAAVFKHKLKNYLFHSVLLSNFVPFNDTTVTRYVQ